MQLPTHCVAEPPQQPRNRQQLLCEQMSEGPRTLAGGSSAQGRSAGWRLRRAGACRRVQEGSWPGPWACRWAQASERSSQVLGNAPWLCASRAVPGRGSPWSPSVLHPVCPRGLPCGAACDTAGCTPSLLRPPRQLRASCAFPQSHPRAQAWLAQAFAGSCPLC